MQINYSQKGHYMYPDDTFAIAFEVENTTELFTALKELFRQCPVWDINLLTHDKFPPEIDKELALELYSKWVTRVKRTLHYLRLGKLFKPLVLEIKFDNKSDKKYFDMIEENGRFIFYDGKYLLDLFTNKVILHAYDISGDETKQISHEQLIKGFVENHDKLERPLPNFFNLKSGESLWGLKTTSKGLILRKRVALPTKLF